VNIGNKDVPFFTNPACSVVQEVLVLSEFTWSVVSLTIVRLLVWPFLAAIVLSLRL
jgi:hypothetical protein